MELNVPTPEMLEARDAHRPFSTLHLQLVVYWGTDPEIKAMADKQLYEIIDSWAQQ